MCGIAGFVSKIKEGSPDSVGGAVQRMCDQMRLRGPDAQGIWLRENVALGHRRLAILDLEPRSNQPMLSKEHDFVIVFNGEIYNYRDLRAELEAQGVVFSTLSDTEVLLNLFIREGANMLPRLRGMFAFAIWNIKTRELFLVRDAYGIKPLYYIENQCGFLFASQVKGLLASGLISNEMEPAGAAGFCLWGSVPEPWTLYRNILSVPAGHWLRVRESQPATICCWHDIRKHWDETPLRISGAQLQEKVREAVRGSVRAHLISDVPVSVFLSGGIDSGAVAGTLTSLGAPVDGITVTFEEFVGTREDETSRAAILAAEYGLKHQVRRVTRSEFERDIPRILKSMDQPSIDGINTWFASKAAAECGYKVVLSGVGGDELFCGYSSFTEIPRAAILGRTIAAIPGASALVGAFCKILAAKTSQSKFKSVTSFMASMEGLYFLRRGLFSPAELPTLLGAQAAKQGIERLGGSPLGIAQLNGRTGASAIGVLESTLYLRNQLLRDCDWASMAHSLELRTPLVDVSLLCELAPYVSAYRKGNGKRMLASAPQSPIPQSILNHAKTGFGVPMTKWLSGIHGQCRTPRMTDHSLPWPKKWALILLESFRAEIEPGNG